MTTPRSSMIRFAFPFFLGGLAGVAALLTAALCFYISHLPDTAPWHHWQLSPEFTADSKIKNFQQYLDLEDRLFSDLDRRVSRSAPVSDPLNRFYTHSISFPLGPDSRNWNRSFEFTSSSPKAGVLLLHGMSDAPYSLRAIGKWLHRDGMHVLGLRLPGHGTAPAALIRTTWQDMAAAVTLALDHLENRTSDRPVYIIGYSTGGALGLHQLLSSKETGLTARVKGLVLISPALGLTPLASLAAWKQRLSRLPGMEKLAWVDIRHEYNPYKYNSFPANAGDQVFRLTRELNRQLTAATPAQLNALPPILTFHSVADATVSVDAVIQTLYGRLRGQAHDLTLFDINRRFADHPLVTPPRSKALADLYQTRHLPYTLTRVTNRSEHDSETVLKISYGSEQRQIPLGLDWPRGIYSLSHVALPFTQTDPLYGSPFPGTGRRVKTPALINLGAAVLRGERGLLNLPESEILRLKWNPFYSYLQTRIREFIADNMKGNFK